MLGQRYVRSVELKSYIRYFTRKGFIIDSAIYEDKQYMRRDLLNKVKKTITHRHKSKSNSGRQVEINSFLLENTAPVVVTKPDDSFWVSIEKAKHNLAGEAAIVEYNENRRNETIKKNNDVIFTKKLESYLQTCIEVDLITEARSTLGFYRRLHKDRNISKKIMSVAPYNVVMNGLASQNNLEKMKRLLKAMIDDGHQPNCETYSIFLNYLSQQEMNKDISVTLISMKKFMDKLGISEDDVLGHVKDPTIYANIVQAFTILDPAFEPVSPKPSAPKCVKFTQSLLEPLNSTLHESLKTSLVLNSMTVESINKMALKQLDIEEKRSLVVKRIDSKESTEESIFYDKKLKSLEEMWRTELTKKFSAELKRQEQTFKQARIFDFKIYPCLVALPPEIYVDIMIQKIYYLVDTYHAKSEICHKLGEEVFNRYRINYMKKHGYLEKLNNLYLDYCRLYVETDAKDSSWLPRKTLQTLCDKHNINDLESLQGPTEWSSSMIQKVGTFLFQLIIENVFVYNEENGEKQLFRAFYEIETTYAAGYGCFKLYVYPLLEKCILKATNQCFTYLPDHCPMLAPSMPWTSLYYGGHPYGNNYCIRMRNASVVQHKRIQELGVEQIYPFLDGLNVLGSIPFKINNKVLDIAIELFNSGEFPEVDIPQHPDLMKFPSSDEVKFPIEDTIAKFKHNKALQYAFGDWLFMLQKLSIANHFRDDILWYPFDGDFRGRMYPCSEYFNHYQADPLRSLFMFGEGKKLGELGLKWLKANVMNLAGQKGDVTLEEKVKYCDEIIDVVLDSAKNPLKGERWWMKSGDPLQTLAACIELSDALESDDPTEYISHLPVTQDGSCNGLQHYAALGRDLRGGELVNLLPSTHKQDVYNEVAKIVEEKRIKDLTNEDDEIRSIAGDLDGLITRNLVKRNVMTTVYGVSLFGAQNQIEQNLKDLDFPEPKRRKTALYVANKVFKSLGDVFTRTKIIQDWLTESAKIISRIGGRPVEWESPLGFPIIQNYTNDKIQSDLHLCVHCDTNLDYLLRPDLSKQRTAFPANFIHSLDASHMILTALYCQQAGIYFTSVHDCFWTHAADIPIMNKICRSQFVELHSLPILENLGKFHKENFGFVDSQVQSDLLLKKGDMYRLNLHFEHQFSRGSLDLKKVLDSEFFFS